MLLFSFARKLRRILARLLVLPLLLLVRIIRPLICFRFGPLLSSRIGHCIANTEVYLCERDQGLHGQGVVDVFYHQRPIANRQLARMWDRTLLVSRVAQPLYELNRFLPGGVAHVISMRENGDRDIHGFLAQSKPHLTFTPGEQQEGRRALATMGISEGTPFVCVHSREAGYLRQQFPTQDFRYHDFRDSTIGNFLLAAEALASKGYAALRTGVGVREALASTNPMVIDYATKFRSDFLDVYFGAHCHFYLGDSCGFHSVPMMFRRPVAIVNMVPLGVMPTWGPNDLVIPKKLWRISEQRFLTFREILHSPIGTFARSEDYKAAGIEVCENTPQEITALAMEMDARLAGHWKQDSRDDDLQQQFWSLLPKTRYHGVMRSRIGAEFLRENAHLLE